MHVPTYGRIGLPSRVTLPRGANLTRNASREAVFFLEKRLKTRLLQTDHSFLTGKTDHSLMLDYKIIAMFVQLQGAFATHSAKPTSCAIKFRQNLSCLTSLFQYSREHHIRFISVNFEMRHRHAPVTIFFYLPKFNSGTETVVGLAQSRRNNYRRPAESGRRNGRVRI